VWQAAQLARVNDGPNLGQPDGLSADEAAAVLGLKPATFRKRLSRARELLNRDDTSVSASPQLALAAAPATSLEMT
jgi:hypothetical protein